jgi:hypothetical protein
MRKVVAQMDRTSDKGLKKKRKREREVNFATLHVFGLQNNAKVSCLTTFTDGGTRKIVIPPEDIKLRFDPKELMNSS